MAFREFFNFYNEKPRAIIRGIGGLDDCFADLFPQFMAGKFGVSKHAALIRLEKSGAILGAPMREYRTL